MSTLIIGGAGNMGQRYGSILRWLRKDYEIFDKHHDISDLDDMVKKSDSVIITTPTITHSYFIRLTLRHKKPILCEKPLTTNIEDLRELISEIRHSNTPFSMIYQYSMLVAKNLLGPTKYNYFKHGSDGLFWDCIQIIGLANSYISIREDSPIWQCVINGYPLELSHMDRAYIDFIEQWKSGEVKQDLSHLRDVHEMTHSMQENYDAKQN